MDWKLELIVLPVSDVDRAKDFYTQRAGFELLVDHRAGEGFRVVQLTPPGSACAIAVMRDAERAGSVQGMHLVVDDVDAARAELAERGVATSEVFHFEQGRQAAGPDPERRDYGSFLSFSDPDGNGWMAQEVRRGAAGPDRPPVRDRLQIVRDAYGAYESGDRSVIEAILAEDFVFYSPPDPGIDRATYFERCWPNSETIESFELVRLAELGDEVLVTYESTKADGRRFRNTEIHRFDGDRICRVEVYFGWDLA
jgi:ketosteroid isomerase-like protein/predicted enzyme related to lactoylglutathione lyase